MLEYLENVEYGQAAGQSLRMDLCLPSGGDRAPAAVIVHGGAWVAGDRKNNVQPLFQPLTEAGVAWFSISYRLARPEGGGSLADALASALSLNDAIEDVLQALAHVRNCAPEYRIDPN